MDPINKFICFLGRDKYRIFPLRPIRPWLQSTASGNQPQLGKSTRPDSTRPEGQLNIPDVFNNFKYNDAKSSILLVKCDGP